MSLSALIPFPLEKPMKKPGFVSRIPFSLIVISIVTLSPTLAEQSSSLKTAGVAWNVRGAWTQGTSAAAIPNGGAVPPGSLLLPDSSAGEHSITVLLPDGQRIFDECYTPQDCQRGFRVPTLSRKPDASAVEMLAHISAALSLTGNVAQSAPHLPEDETAVAIGAHNQVDIRGLAAALQNGRYWYRLRSLSSARPVENGLLNKTTRDVTIAVPGPGLYEVTFTDSRKKPRVTILVAALDGQKGKALIASFNEAYARLEQWDEDNQGWPIHDFQRAYLTSLFARVRPAVRSSAAMGAISRPGVTAEPRFWPPPGTFNANTGVDMRCDTPGATIHYTVDGSQPLQNSPEYRSSIMVKGTALTIKAYATAPGKKDSAVVTGTFRIQDEKS